MSAAVSLVPIEGWATTDSVVFSDVSPAGASKSCDAKSAGGYDVKGASNTYSRPGRQTSKGPATTQVSLVEPLPEADVVDPELSRSRRARSSRGDAPPCECYRESLHFLRIRRRPAATVPALLYDSSPELRECHRHAHDHERIESRRQDVLVRVVTINGSASTIDRESRLAVHDHRVVGV